MQTIIANINSTLDNSYMALKVCGAAANEFALTTLQNHKTEVNGHPDLAEQYRTTITNEVIGIMDTLDIINQKSTTILTTLNTLEEKLTALEARY